MEVANLEQKLKTEIDGSEKIQPSELSLCMKWMSLH